MYTITVMDTSDSGMLSVSLSDLLDTVKPALGQVEWSVRGLEIVGESANELYDIELRGALVRTSELEGLATRIEQVIDGEFSAYSWLGHPNRHVLAASAPW
jgi:hypothetical protein